VSLKLLTLNSTDTPLITCESSVDPDQLAYLTSLIRIYTIGLLVDNLMNLFLKPASVDLIKSGCTEVHADLDLH
jgi:hypothetical protein